MHVKSRKPGLRRERVDFFSEDGPHKVGLAHDAQGNPLLQIAGMDETQDRHFCVTLGPVETYTALLVLTGSKAPGMAELRQRAEDHKKKLGGSRS